MRGQGLELENVIKRCGDFTPVGDVSLRIPRGSIHGKPTMQWIRRAAA
jgi:ABC-type uncharacterized transport system ATPase subunit